MNDQATQGTTPSASPALSPGGSATFTRFHLCQSIEGPLMNWPRNEWRRALKYINKADGSAYKSVEELKQAFLDELAKGHKVVPIGECDNFDWEDGCKGHRIESQNNQAHQPP